MTIKINKPEEELINGLNLYLERGYIEPNYIDCHSYDECADYADAYLDNLSSINPGLTQEYYKKIIESDIIWNNDFKATCIFRLLLSEENWKYAFDYIYKNSDNLSLPILKESLDYFYYANNDPQAYDIPEGLLNKLQARYEQVKDHEEAEFYKLNQTYNDFAEAYGLKTIKRPEPSSTPIKRTNAIISVRAIFLLLICLLAGITAVTLALTGITVLLKIYYSIFYGEHFSYSASMFPSYINIIFGVGIIFGIAIFIATLYYKKDDY